MWFNFSLLLFISLQLKPCIVMVNVLIHFIYDVGSCRCREYGCFCIVLLSLMENVLWACCYLTDFNHKMQIYMCDWFTTLCYFLKNCGPQMFHEGRSSQCKTVLRVPLWERDKMSMVHVHSCCGWFFVPSSHRVAETFSVYCFRFQSKIHNPKYPESVSEGRHLHMDFWIWKILMYFNSGFSSLFWKYFPAELKWKIYVKYVMFLRRYTLLYDLNVSCPELMVTAFNYSVVLTARHTDSAQHLRSFCCLCFVFSCSFSEQREGALCI